MKDQTATITARVLKSDRRQLAVRNRLIHAPLECGDAGAVVPRAAFHFEAETFALGFMSHNSCKSERQDSNRVPVRRSSHPAPKCVLRFRLEYNYAIRWGWVEGEVSDCGFTPAARESETHRVAGRVAGSSTVAHEGVK